MKSAPLLLSPLLLLLLLGEGAAQEACTTQDDFLRETGALNAACCSDASNCAASKTNPSGLPTTCSRACSLVLGPVRSRCRAYLDQDQNFAVKALLDETATTCRIKGCAGTVDRDGVEETQCPSRAKQSTCVAACRPGFVLQAPAHGGHRRAQASNGIPFICSNEGVWEPQQDFVCAEAQPVDHTESDFSPAVTTGTFTGAGPGEGLDFSGTFVYAVDVRGPGGVTVGDATFTSDDAARASL